MAEKLEITQSMIGLYEKCGLAFQYRYLDGIIIPPTANLTVGSSVDAGITHNLSQKIQTGRDVSESEVIDTTAAFFDREAPDTFWQGTDPGTQKDIAVTLVRHHHTYIAPEIAPVAVQEKLTLQLEHEDFNLAGTLDVIEKNHIIADSKTTGSAYRGDEVKTNLQPAMYSLLYEKTKNEVPIFRYDVLVKPSRGLGAHYQRIAGIPTEHQKQMAFKRAETLSRAIKSGVFHRAPGPEIGRAYWCSEKQCGYWNMCPYGGKR